jgi:predicted Zn-dependent protease with MMP-like domain
MSEQEPIEEEYADDKEQGQEEDDARSKFLKRAREGIPRSSFFFACLSFLIAFICLGIFVSRYLDFLSYLLLLLAIIVFGGVGVLFLRQNSLLNRTARAQMEKEGDEEEQALLRIQEEEEGIDEAAQQDSFERLVEEALISIPAEFQEKMENVVVLVEHEPSQEVLQRMGTKEGYTLFGLYEGVPLTIQDHAGALRPEVITIYQGPIERYCGRDPDRIREQVRRTVLHEVAHHFGIDHDEMPIWVK